MENLWAKLETQLEADAPELLDRLRPGISEPTLNAFEIEIGQPLPDDVRTAYLRHDGCKLTSHDEVGMFGRFNWLSVDQIRETWLLSLENYDPSDPYFYEDDQWCDLPIRPWCSAPPAWIPVAKGIGFAGFVYVDLLPGPTGRLGQLIGEDIHGMSKWVVATSLTEYITHLSSELECGRVHVFTNRDTQQQNWRCTDGRPFVAPGFAKVFG